ncbi:hypothetical protein Hanom_Chr03g00244091 [Helianthus anomalus]
MTLFYRQTLIFTLSFEQQIFIFFKCGGGASVCVRERVSDAIALKQVADH